MTMKLFELKLGLLKFIEFGQKFGVCAVVDYFSVKKEHPRTAKEDM
jgi:hypothetical protein